MGDARSERIACIEKLLQTFIPGPISHISFSAGANPGDNVIGKMLSLQVTSGKGQVDHLIIKSLVPFHTDEVSFEDEQSARVFTVMRVFATELSFYDRIRPAMENMFQYCLPAPKYYFGRDDTNGEGLGSCLILEDLRPHGYKMADKIDGLTLQEVLLVLKNLAKFHAMSYVYLMQTEEQAQSSKQGTTTEPDPLEIHVFARTGGLSKNMNKAFVFKAYSGMIEVLRETVGLGELEGKLQHFSIDPHGLILESSKLAADNFFRVITHGDLWVNNLLFKYDDSDDRSKPVDVQFIDFQQCRYSSVFDELHYFFYTSTSRQFRKDFLTQCLEFYYKTFSEVLREIKYEIPDEFTWENFYTGYHKYLGAAFCYAVIAVPFQVGMPPDATIKSLERVDSSRTLNEDNFNTSVSLSEQKLKSEMLRNNTLDKNGLELELETILKGMFETIAADLKAAALNSPVAIKRLQDLCNEMHELLVF